MLELYRLPVSQLDRCAFANARRKKPMGAIRQPRGTARYTAGYIAQDDDGELQTLRLMHAHQSYAAAAFLHERRFSIALFGSALSFDMLYERAERKRRTALEAPSEVLETHQAAYCLFAVGT